MLQRFETFVSGITACYKYIQRIKAMEMTEFGLKGTHMMCIFLLSRYADGLTAAVLCQLCAEDKAAISRTLNTLRDQGFILSEGSAYRAKWRLTEQGEQVAEKLEKVIEQWVCIGGDGLTEEERTSFYNSLERIATNLRENSKGNE